MKKLVVDVLKLNEKLLVCDEDQRDALIARVEDLLEKATLNDLKAICEEEKHIAKYEWRHQEYVDYYMDMIRDVEIDATLSDEDL